MNKEKVDVLVIGAGPSGSVAASIVQQAGYSVKMVEKQQFPRFVIGESLLPGCMQALEAADFIGVLEQRGYQKKFGAKFVKDDFVCDYNFAEKFTPGWEWTWQVPRADFDKTLADTLEERGVSIDYETSVTGIRFDGTNSITTAVGPDGREKEIEARFIIDGSGYGRVIPRLFDLDKPSSQPMRKTLFTHVKDEKRMLGGEPYRITIVVHRPGVWAWVIPFSNGNTSIGFVGAPEYFDQYDGTPEQQLRAIIASEPLVSKRFEEVEYLFEPRILEAWSISTLRFHGDGFVLTGNATEFLDPVFSSGVTLAVNSSMRAGQLTVKHLQGEAVDWEKDFTGFLMQGVNTFRSYVEAWYDGTLDTIFFAERQDEEIKRQVCSVLAGYVWDTENPYVKNHDTALKRLARLIKLDHALSQ